MYSEIDSRRETFSSLTIAVMLSFGLIYGQTISSSIGGRVTDATGAAVPNAVITVRNLETGAVNSAVTDSTGTYSVPALLAGTYDVSAAKSGFQTYTASKIQL